MILSYLDLSLNHLTERTSGQLLTELHNVSNWDRLNWPAVRLVTYDEGLFITVPDFDHMTDKQHDALPPDLATVFRFAWDRSVTLIRFDADGGVMTGLPTFEW